MIGEINVVSKIFQMFENLFILDQTEKFSDHKQTKYSTKITFFLRGSNSNGIFETFAGDFG